MPDWEASAPSLGVTLEALSLLVLSFSSLLSFSSFSLSLSRKEKIVALVEYEAGVFFFFATVALQRNPFFFSLRIIRSFRPAKFPPLKSKAPSSLACSLTSLHWLSERDRIVRFTCRKSTVYIHVWVQVVERTGKENMPPRSDKKSSLKRERVIILLLYT